jgi:NADH-quinone oxidoreductase subunit G
VKKPKNVELGPRVTLDAERCVLCSRCIRFMQEVAKDDVLGFEDRGSFTTIACHPDRKLDSNYSLNTVDICPVGALTSSDFRFKMRVWFLKETKTIDINDGLGANITIGARENQIYRVTPRENNDVNGVWIPDSHRLNFKYLSREDRLKAPAVAGSITEWQQALAIAGEKLKKHRGDAIAMIASARMTNEELFLAKRLATALGITRFDILPRTGEPDGIMIVADRNPNTTGARLIGIAGKEPGARLKEVADGVKSGAIKALICLGEDATKCGLTEEDLRKLDALIVTDILPNKTTALASVLLPASGWAEKRGSMINVKGRLQRLNRAVDAPQNARDDWEILRDLIQAVNGSNGLYMIEDVFKLMAGEVSKFANLSLSKIGDLGVPLIESKPESAQ